MNDEAHNSCPLAPLTCTSVASGIDAASLVSSREGLIMPQPGSGGRVIYSTNKWAAPFVVERGEGDLLTDDEAGNAITSSLPGLHRVVLDSDHASR